MSVDDNGFSGVILEDGVVDSDTTTTSSRNVQSSPLPHSDNNNEIPKSNGAAAETCTLSQDDVSRSIYKSAYNISSLHLLVAHLCLLARRAASLKKNTYLSSAC